MAPPIFPILYWRDIDTKTSESLYDTIEKLLDEKPEQCLVFDTDARQLEHVLEGGDDSVTNEPSLNAAGQITVSKQQGRSPVPTLLLEGNCNVDELVWRQLLRSFSRKGQVEHTYHKYGILGFYSPELPDYNLDPTDLIGYTMALPIFDYTSASKIVSFRISLSMGVLALT